ncbi:MAG: DNA repair and recombination protein RadA, partial [Nanoarchaeota archaeon]|nr:DNA repair and recombination protein RadA [Nanoarchaeota archaeon]
MVKSDETTELVEEEETDDKKSKKKKKEEKKPELIDIPGVGPGAVAKLEAAGIYDLMGIAVLTPPQLAEMAGMGEAAARKAIQASRQMMDLGFSDGLAFDEKRKELFHITTGSKNLDNLLGGKGIETKSITEAFGSFGSGKTQLGLSLAVMVQLPVEKGGANGKAVYIDTEGTFRPERVRQFAEGIGANSEKVLKNILVARAFNSDHQMLLLDKVAELIKDGEPIRLIVIDSLTAHFRAEFTGRGQLADRQQRLNRYLHNLMKVAEMNNLAVYVTNQVMSDPAQLFGDPTKAIGGNIVGHACLGKGTVIQLSDGGFCNVEDICGDKVLSGKLSAFSFENGESETRWINNMVDKIYEITTTGKIKSSGLHRYFCVNDFSIVEKEARDLKEGDFILMAGKISIEGAEQKLPNFSVERVGGIGLSDAGLVKEKIGMLGLTQEEVCSEIRVTPRQLRRVLNSNALTSIGTIENLNNHLGLELISVPVMTAKHKNLILPIALTKEFAQILGYFLGDGNLEKRGVRFRDARREVLELYNELFFKIFGREGKITKVKDKNCFSLDFNSKEARDFIFEVKKDVYNLVGRSSPEVVRGFVRGFVDAEGYMNKKRNRINISQKNKQTLEYLQMFLLRFGIRSSLYTDVGAKKMNYILIDGRDIAGFLKVGFSSVEKQKRLVECIRNISMTYPKEMMPVSRREAWMLLEDAGLFPSKFLKSRGDEYK